MHSGNMFGFGLFIYLQLSIKYLKILKNKQDKMWNNFKKKKFHIYEYTAKFCI